MREKRALVAVAAAVIGLIAWWPVETRFGVNYQWSSRTIHLYEKAIDFVSRDLQTRRLVADVAGAAATDERRALTLFDWVRAHVRPVPDGFPVVDDHVFHIIVRGYGAPDQRTEAFALLASYADMPATAMQLNSPSGAAQIVVAFVEIGDRIHAFDVVNGLVFRRRDGRLADVDDLRADPSLIRSAAHELDIAGVPYEQFYATVADIRPNFARMAMQQPWQRLKTEARKLITGTTRK